MLLKRSTFTTHFDKSIFENISWSYDNFRTHHEVATSLKDKNPFTITVLLENLKYEYRNKKEYVKKTKIPIESKYRVLLYDYFFEEHGQEEGNKLYGQWLDKYHSVHEVDEFIIKHELEPKYRQKILSRFRNHKKLFKERIKIEKDRLYNFPEPLNRVDWRNPYDNIFIWEDNDKKVARRGGSGSSGSRETNSIFIYGLLELNKTKPVPSYLFLYSEKNTILFIKKFNSLCVPFHDIGENYHLDYSEDEQLKQHGVFLLWDISSKIKAVEVGSYRQIMSCFK